MLIYVQIRLLIFRSHYLRSCFLDLIMILNPFRKNVSYQNYFIFAHSHYKYIFQGWIFLFVHIIKIVCLLRGHSKLDLGIFCVIIKNKKVIFKIGISTKEKNDPQIKSPANKCNWIEQNILNGDFCSSNQNPLIELHEM